MLRLLSTPIATPRAPHGRWARALPLGLGVTGSIATALLLVAGGGSGPAVAAVAAILLVGCAALVAVYDRQLARQASRPATLRGLIAAVEDRTAAAGPEVGAEDLAEVEELAEAALKLRRRLADARGAAPTPEDRSGEVELAAWDDSMTRSGLYDPPRLVEVGGGDGSAEFATGEMVNRLDPRTLRWIESTPSEREFLGLSLAELRQIAFPEFVHPDHRELAVEQLRAALIKGEAHGLVYRIVTARGEVRAIEMNVSVRYSPDRSASYLRCHVADVTDKLLAGRELRRRTHELTLANRQLRRFNRELQELKDRYRDLYQHAPAMYFCLGPDARFLECNRTLLTTLGYRREDLIGRPYRAILPDSERPGFDDRFAAFRRAGTMEAETRWLKADGTPIDVLVNGSVVTDPDGRFLHSRSMARDITDRKRLAAELQAQNRRLERANEELSRKNRELDEYTYVVSHDLQEPIRTLISFSDFLARDCGAMIDEKGRAHLGYLVAAARRMRALILDLLDLSRAGRVVGEFRRLDLDAILGRVRTDLGELIRARGAELVVRGPLPAVRGDGERVGQLFANLIANGVKYNRQDRPRVEVGAEPDDGTGFATFYVRDDGIGIEPQYHARIFELFRRLHARDEFGGTGAGLAICQKIAQAHGGRIWVESAAGAGSTFRLTLPRAPADGPATGPS